MFSKWIVVLLKYYDFLGYYTEFALTTKYHHAVFVVFLLHIFLASCLSAFSIQYILLPDFYPMLTMINSSFQLFCVLIVYWAVIIESYLRRNVQKQFWRILEVIESQHYRRVHSQLTSYLIKFFEFFVAFVLAQITLNAQFISHTGLISCYLLAYLILVKISQDRMLYYLLHVELLHIELKMIEQEVQRMVIISRNKCSLLNTHLTMENQRNRFKCIRDYYRLAYDLNVCINSIFGWSHFATILCYFYFLLTDLNWAYAKISERVQMQGFSCCYLKGR